MLQGYRKYVLIAVSLGAAGLVMMRFAGPDPVAVLTALVQRGLVEASVVNTRAGTVKACRRAHLAPPVGGQVARLLVKEGDMVKTGQLLLALWNDDREAELRLAEDEALAVRSRGEEVCVRAQGIEREAKRKVELQKKNLAAEEEVDRAVTLAKAQQAACLASQSDVLVSDARVEARRAALEKSRLRAPFPGRVAEVNAEVGEFVTPSPPGIATLPAIDLIDTTCLYISAPIDEVDAPRVKPGMPARIILDAFREQAMPGTVRRVAAYVLELEKQARTVDVEADFVEFDPALGLLPGYSADLEVVIESRADVLHVPTEAILEGPRVLVFDRGVLADREVETGIANWRLTEVLNGVKEGERVVTSVDRAGVEAGAEARLETSDDGVTQQ